MALKAGVLLPAFTLTLLFFVSTAEAFCFDQAGAEYNLNPDMLRSIAQTESSGIPTGEPHWNADGTYDYGLMGINSAWYCYLRRHYGKPYADQVWASLPDPCFNARFGAWILSNCVASYGDTWRAVGCYNAKTEWKRQRYALKVLKHLHKKAKAKS